VVGLNIGPNLKIRFRIWCYK